jgi:hypothetical protein
MGNFNPLAFTGINNRMITNHITCPHRCKANSFTLANIAATFAAINSNFFLITP